MTPDNSIAAGQRADDPHGDQSGVPMDERTIVLWVPDFPLYAARSDNEVPEGHWHWWTSMVCMCVTARRGM